MRGAAARRLHQVAAASLGRNPPRISKRCAAPLHADCTRWRPRQPTLGQQTEGDRKKEMRGAAARRLHHVAAWTANVGTAFFKGEDRDTARLPADTSRLSPPETANTVRLSPPETANTVRLSPHLRLRRVRNCHAAWDCAGRDTLLKEYHVRVRRQAGDLSLLAVGLPVHS